MKPMSEFFTVVLGIMGLFMILVSYHFAFLELLWVVYTALALHVIFITVALPYLIGTLFFDDLVTQDIFTAYTGGAAVPIPDSFFMYNAFLEVRPRIHAIAVKKIS